MGQELVLAHHLSHMRNQLRRSLFVSLPVANRVVMCWFGTFYIFKSFIIPQFPGTAMCHAKYLWYQQCSTVRKNWRME